MKKFSISIFVFCLLLLIGYYYSYDHTMKKQETVLASDSEESKDTAVDSTKIVDAEADMKETGYYIGLKDGQVVVYEADKTTIYEYTDIKYDGLPDKIKEQIAEGKYIKDQKSLYSFLENYSS